MLTRVDENTEFADIKRPYITYEFYCLLLREKKDYNGYIHMLTKAYDVNATLNSSDEIKRELLKTYLDTFDKNTWVAQAYKHKLVANLDKLWLIISPVGYIDYIDIDFEGNVNVISPLSEDTYEDNTMSRFNSMLGNEALTCIPLLIHNSEIYNSLMSTVPPCKEYDSFLNKICDVEVIAYKNDGSDAEDGKVVFKYTNDENAAVTAETDDAGKIKTISVTIEPAYKLSWWKSLLVVIAGFCLGCLIAALVIPLFSLITSFFNS